MGRSEVLLLMIKVVVVGGTEVGERVWVSVTVVGDAVVEVAVTVAVRWMNEVSKTETVFSIVSVWKTVTSSVTKIVTPALVVMVMGPWSLGTRGMRVMVGMMGSAMIVCVGEVMRGSFLARQSGAQDVRIECVDDGSF